MYRITKNAVRSRKALLNDGFSAKEADKIIAENPIRGRPDHAGWPVEIDIPFCGDTVPDDYDPAKASYRHKILDDLSETALVKELKVLVKEKGVKRMASVIINGHILDSLNDAPIPVKSKGKVTPAKKAEWVIINGLNEGLSSMAEYVRVYDEHHKDAE